MTAASVTCPNGHHNAERLHFCGECGAANMSPSAGTDTRMAIMEIRTWAVGALLAATSVAAGLGIPTASADDPTPTVNSCSAGPETKPSEMTIFCDNTLRVDKITWSSWNAVRASGRGIQFLLVCEPNCA